MLGVAEKRLAQFDEIGSLPIDHRISKIGESGELIYGIVISYTIVLGRWKSGIDFPHRVLECALEVREVAAR